MCRRDECLGTATNYVRAYPAMSYVYRIASGERAADDINDVVIHSFVWRRVRRVIGASQVFRSSSVSQQGG